MTKSGQTPSDLPRSTFPLFFGDEVPQLQVPRARSKRSGSQLTFRYPPDSNHLSSGRGLLLLPALINLIASMDWLDLFSPTPALAEFSGIVVAVPG